MEITQLQRAILSVPNPAVIGTLVLPLNPMSTRITRIGLCTHISRSLNSSDWNLELPPRSGWAQSSLSVGKLETPDSGGVVKSFPNTNNGHGAMASKQEQVKVFW